MWCFVHFDLDMCFALQRRALFRHRSFQKWPEPCVHFSTSQLPKMVWEWCALDILTWKCASRHNGVQFFISHLASWLHRAYFSTTQSHKSLEKHSESPLSYLFAHLHLLSSHSFSSLLFSLLDFSSRTLPTSAFPSLHIVGSLTSKLPSIIAAYIPSYCGRNP